MDSLIQTVLWGAILIIALLAALLFYFLLEKSDRHNRRRLRRIDNLEETRELLENINMRQEQLASVILQGRTAEFEHRVPPIGKEEQSYPSSDQIKEIFEPIIKDLFGPERRRVNIAADLYEIAVDQVDIMSPGDFPDNFGMSHIDAMSKMPMIYAEWALVLADALIEQGGKANE